MSDFIIPPPGDDEYAPYARAYVHAAREVPDVRELLRRQPGLLRAAVEHLGEQEAQRGYEPGKWSVKEVIGHLSDSERVFTYRLLRIARGDETPLAGFEQDDYVRGGSFDGRRLAALLAEFEAVRAASVTLVEGLEPAALERRGVANGAPVTARALVHIIGGHVQHHLRILRDRYGLGGASAQSQPVP
jgi:hypothetical protein